MVDLILKTIFSRFFYFDSIWNYKTFREVENYIRYQVPRYVNRLRHLITEGVFNLPKRFVVCNTAEEVKYEELSF